MLLKPVPYHREHIKLFQVRSPIMRHDIVYLQYLSSALTIKYFKSNGASECKEKLYTGKVSKNVCAKCKRNNLAHFGVPNIRHEEWLLTPVYTS